MIPDFRQPPPFQFEGFQRRLHLDYETRSEENLKTSGTHKYAKHPSTRPLMLGWAFDDEPIQLWIPEDGDMDPRLREGLLCPSTSKVAFNATFERLITQHCLGIPVPVEQWRCSMIASYYLGFAGGLDKILSAIGLEMKDKRGGQLINMFSSPAPKNHKADWYTRENRPSEFDEFGQYCVQDVKVERQLLHWLTKFPQMAAWDWTRYQLDQRVNDRGVPMSLDMATGAIELWEIEKDRLSSLMAARTGLSKVTRGPFLEWLSSRGQPLDNLQKETLRAAVQSPMTPPDVKEALDLWMQKEAKAVSKYSAVVKGTCDDGRARGMFQFKGASRTDRTSGRRIQLQNLKRAFAEQDRLSALTTAIANSDSDALRAESQMTVGDALGGCIRHVIQPARGHSLVVCDLTSIESVVLGWLTYCQEINQTFRQGRDSYRVFASKYFHVPYDDVTKDQRGFSKPPVLGCGYMLGWKGLMAYSEGYGVVMKENQSRAAVDTFREMYHEIPAFWKWIGQAAKYVISTGLSLQGYRLTLERDASFLRIWLPSGRALSYFLPEIQMRPAPWDPSSLIENVSYMGMDIRNQWSRIFAHAGLFTENIVQSLAMDVLFNGLSLAEANGMTPVLQVHDEIGCEEPDAVAHEKLEVLRQCMTSPLEWAPDMWLGADGYVSKFYTKD